MPVLIKQMGQQPSDQPQEGMLDKVTRNIYRSGKEAIKAPFGIGSLVESATGLKPSNLTPQQQELYNKLPGANLGIPTAEKVEQNVFQPFEDRFLPKGYGKPQTDFEHGLDKAVNVASLSALSAAFGLGSLGSNLMSGFASLAGSEAAGALGAGPVGQVLGGIAGGMGAGLVRRDVGFGGVRKRVEALSKENYTKADKIGKRLNLEAPEYKEFLNQQKLQAESGMSGLTKNQSKVVLHEINKALDDFAGNRVNVGILNARKKHFNKLLSGSENENLKNYFKGLVGGANEFGIDKAAQKFPQWGEPYKIATDAHIGLKGSHALRGMLEKSTDIAELAKNPVIAFGMIGPSLGYGLARGGIKGALFGAGGAIAGPLAARYVFRGADLLYRSQGARDILKDLMKSAAENSIPGVTQNLIALNKIVDQEDRQQGNIRIKKFGSPNKVKVSSNAG